MKNSIKNTISRANALELLQDPTYFDKDILDLSMLEISKIDDFAFSALNLKIKKLILPKTLEKIGQSAFMLNKIKSVVLPFGLKEIGESAFENNLISKLEIPSTLKMIDNSSFAFNKISKIDLESWVDKLGYDVLESNPLDELIFRKKEILLDNFAFATNEPKKVHIWGDFDLSSNSKSIEFSTLTLDFYKNFDLFENSNSLEIEFGDLFRILNSFKWINLEQIVLHNNKYTNKSDIEQIDLTFFVSNYELNKTFNLKVQLEQEFEKELKII